MKATLTVQMDNAAFEDGPNEELARILLRASKELLAGWITPMSLLDFYGNTVGSLTIEED